MNRRTGLMLLMLAAVLLIAGCTANLPQASLSGVDYSKADYKVLGPVKGESDAVALFGGMIILDPDAGFRMAYEDALNAMPGADALINTYSDMEITQYFGGLYIKYHTRVYGTAIKVGNDLMLSR